MKYSRDWGLILKIDKTLTSPQLHCWRPGALCITLEPKMTVTFEKEPGSMSDQHIMKAMFTQQRIQIMHLGKHHKEYTDAYIFAWESGVYPFLHDLGGASVSSSRVIRRLF